MTKQGKKITCKTDNFLPPLFQRYPPVPGSSSSSTLTSQDLSSKSPAQERSDELAPREWCKTETTIKKGDGNRDSDNRFRDLPEWLDWLTENLEDTEVPAPAHISQDSDSERPTKVASKSRKHSIYTHFPRDRNCEVCLRTKMTRAPCRRRTGEALLRTEKFGDLITADHKVLNEEGESRDNHRYAVVVQDLATQWIQSFRCKTKTLQETEKRLRKFLEPSPKPKVIYSDNSLEFRKSCEDLSWNQHTSTPHRSAADGIAERAVRRVKDQTSRVLLQSGLDQKWWADMLLPSAKCPRPPGRRENSVRKAIWRTIQSANTSFIRFQREINQEFISLARKYYLVSFLGMNWSLCGIWKGDILIADLEDLEKLDESEIDPRRINAKQVLISQKGDEFIFPVADGTAKFSGRDYEFREPTLRREQTVRSEDFSGDLQGEPGESQPTESTDDAEAWADFWSIQGDVIYRHHNEPRGQLFVPKEETFPFPLKYIDVTRSTHTDLDVMQEKRVDDLWNVDGSRDLSDPWTGFTQFTLLEEKTSRRIICGPGRD